MSHPFSYRSFLMPPLLAVALLHTVAAQHDPDPPVGIRATHWLNVQEFGAVGDGRHDDTDAIQRAIDAARFPVDPANAAEFLDVTKRNSPQEGHGWGGVVYLPMGVYRTTKPLRLHNHMALIGNKGARPLIKSEAEAALVCWKSGLVWKPGATKGDMTRPEDQQIDMKVRHGIEYRCSAVTLENLRVRGAKYGLHTMGCSANAMQVRDCWFEGAVAGFVSTGFFMGTVIERCQFHPSVWIIANEGARYNTSSMRNCTIGLRGTRHQDWRMRLEGCIQCVKISEICFEVSAQALLLDARISGMNVTLDNIWNYDTGGDSDQAIHVVNGRQITISNVMAHDQPSSVVIEKDVADVFLQNIRAGVIDVKGNSTVTAFGCAPIENAGPGCVINGRVQDAPVSTSAHAALKYRFDGSAPATHEPDRAGQRRGRIVEDAWGDRRDNQTSYVAGSNPDFPGPRPDDPAMGNYLYLNGRAQGENQGHIIIEAEDPWPVWTKDDNWTIEFWYHTYKIHEPDGPQGGRCVLFTLRPSTNIKASPAIQLWLFGGGYPQLRLNGGIDYGGLRLEQGEPFQQHLKAKKSYAGAWTHIAAQQDGKDGKVRLLINGGADHGGETIEQDLDPNVRFGKLNYLQINGLSESWYKAQFAIDEFCIHNQAIPVSTLGFHGVAAQRHR